MPKLYLESYPPLFRTCQPNSNLIIMNNKTSGSGVVDPLPLIDMQCLKVDNLDEVCREWGIFRLVNHGVPEGLLEELKEHAKRVFDLPFNSKQGLIGNGNNKCPLKYFWGTPALNTAGVALPRASGAQNVDWVEGFNVPLIQLSSSSSLAYDLDHHPLVFAFSKLIEEYGGYVTKLASTLFESMIRNLKPDLQMNRTYLDGSTGLVRVYRYPQHCTAEQVQGMHEHTDSSVLSILNEDEVGGLQFLKDDKWFDVKPIPGTLVVNLGDMMQALSDDEYKSVKHKVRLNEHKERVSICYFVFPEENTLIHSSKYKPFTYNDFRAQVQLDVKTFGSKIGLESFRIPQLI